MNQKYEQKFGHIFIIFASGKSAQEMLSALQERHVPQCDRHHDWARAGARPWIMPCLVCRKALARACLLFPLHTWSALHSSCCLQHAWNGWQGPKKGWTYICRCESEPHAELAVAVAEQMKITELRLRKLLSERSTSASASWDGPIAAVSRRAGLLKAQLGASALGCHCRFLHLYPCLRGKERGV